MSFRGQLWEKHFNTVNLYVCVCVTVSVGHVKTFQDSTVLVLVELYSFVPLSMTVTVFCGDSSTR